MRQLHTLTTLSQPQETITGFIKLGLNRTHETLEHSREYLDTFILNTSYNNSPLRVSIFLDVKFTFTKGIPKFDRLVTRTGDDLPVIGAEADRQNIRGVPNKFPGRLAIGEIPETKSVVP